MTLMSELRDCYIKSLDHSATGVLSVVGKVNELLKAVDEELWTHMETEGADPRYYSFRWLTLLLSQEFELPDVLRLWDSLFADENRFEFLHYFCCAMLVHLRKELLTCDFTDILRILQSYPDCDMQVLLTVAMDLQQSHQEGRRSRFVDSPMKKTIENIKSSFSSFWRSLGRNNNDESQ
jgi:hypothetical protein